MRTLRSRFCTPPPHDALAPVFGFSQCDHASVHCGTKQSWGQALAWHVRDCSRTGATSSHVLPPFFW